MWFDAEVLEAVAIDVDDTLCLTEEVCFELENLALQRLGREPMDQQLHLMTWGMPLLEGMRRRSPGIDLEQFTSVYQPLLEEFVADQRLDLVTTATLETLDRLRSDGLKVMLLTSRTQFEMRHLLDPEHVLAGRLDAAYHADNTTHLKPDGRVFDTMLDEHDLAASRCMYVGDSPTDAQAANQAGVLFVGCLASRIRTAADFVGHDVHRFIDSLDELPEVVRDLRQAADGSQDQTEQNTKRA